MIKFTNENLMEFNTPEDLSKLYQSYSVDEFLDKVPGYDRILSIIILKEFLKVNSLDYDFIEKSSFPKEHIADSPKTFKVSENFGLGVAGTGASQTYETNFSIVPTFDKWWKTGHDEIDNYVKYSIIFQHNVLNFKKMTKFQRLSLIQLSQYLTKKSAYVSQAMKGLVGSRYRRGNQYILGDYLENFIRFNSMKSSEFSSFKIIPFLIELNGKPGIGKSTFVDFLCETMHTIFPFYDEQDAVYNRVNDKFWNGYKQQPVVLYDDQNQNRELRYNLDNEIIQLGSGQFVHPPMAFEKNTKFSSVFVVFTTNKKILLTTKVNKGAISRRIKTYTCEPLSNLGEYTENEIEGEKWTYYPEVIQHPFNLEFNNQQFSHVIFDFLSTMTNQRSLNFETKSMFYYINSFSRKTKRTIDEALDDFDFKPSLNAKDIPKQQLERRFLQKKRVNELVFVQGNLPNAVEYGITGLASLPDKAIRQLDNIYQGIQQLPESSATRAGFLKESFAIEIEYDNGLSMLCEKQENRVVLSKLSGGKVVGFYNYDMCTRTYAMNVDTSSLYDSFTRQNFQSFETVLADFYKNRAHVNKDLVLGKYKQECENPSCDAQKGKLIEKICYESFHECASIFATLGNARYSI